MKLPPLSVLATWPKPNYIDPVTRGHGALVVNIVFLSLAFIVTCLRLYTRLRITCSAGFDDVLIVIALGLAIAMCTITSIATENFGFVRHLWDVPVTWLSTAQKLNLTFQVLFSMCSGATKLSVLWFSKRLLGAGSKGLYRSYYIFLVFAMVFVAVSCFAFLFISIFQCTPIRAYWDLNPQYHFHCVNDGALVFAASVVNIITDLLATVLPMPLIWNLKLPTQQRIAVISIFGFGIIVNVAGSIRTVYVYKSMIASYDQTWMGWPVLLAASVEINLGLLCASAPALRPLLSFILPRLFQSSRNYYGDSSKRRSRSFKFFASGRPTKNSQFASHSQSHLNRNKGDIESIDRFEVMRTVEMETWTESRTTNPDPIGSPYGISTHAARVESRGGDAAYTPPRSAKSSGSVSPVSPFANTHPR